MDGALTEKTKAFLQAAFVANPSYSFGDWHIMYNHSVTVMELALQIAQEVPCDTRVLAISALLHDIGKTYPASPEVLRERHAELGWEVSRDFVAGLGLSFDQLATVEEILSSASDSVEATIIKDADIVAFYADPVLQQALDTWGKANGHPDEIQRKLKKVDQLVYEKSRILAQEYIKKMNI